ncbi:MAG TPA: peptide ABC transporter substrate-binding protein [Chromatiales bacterium]|nr:peptide ABC transporter substrate-binding protein [Chromatiales bacterium]
MTGSRGCRDGHGTGWMSCGKKLAVLLAGLLILSPAMAGRMVLNRGTSAEPPSLDPSLGAGTMASPLIGDMVVGLLARGPGGDVQPGSAESWSVSDDGLVYTFRLRENLRWSDGTPLTGNDFVYSFRRIADPATGARMASVFSPIRNMRAVAAKKLLPDSIGVSAPDERTVVFELEQPTPYFIELIGNVQIAPVPRHVIEKYGRAWTRAGNMVTNGAFVLAERVPQSYIRLKKNPYFYDADNVKLDEVYWYPTQDLSTSLKRFRAGELDIILNFPPSQMEWIRKNMPESLHITDNLATYFLVVNMRRKPFDDIRVRRALYMSIDREAITDRLLKTGVKPAWSFVSPKFRHYDGIRMPEQDMPFAERQKKARKLLADAGFGSDNPLKVPLYYDTQEENRKIMVAISAMWRAIGVQTDLTDVEFRLLFRKVRGGDFDVSRWAYFAPFNDAYSFLQLFLSDNPNNWVGLKNARYDALLNDSNVTMDPDKRKQILQDAEKLLMSQYPVIPISFYIGRRLVSPRVKGWVDNPSGPTSSRFLWIE